MRVVPLVALLVSGCSYLFSDSSSDPDGGAARSDAAVDVSPDASIPAVPCGTAAALTDGFDSPSGLFTPFVFGNGSFLPEDSKVTFGISPGAQSGAGLRSNHGYDLSDSSFVFEVEPLPADADTSFQLTFQERLVDVAQDKRFTVAINDTNVDLLDFNGVDSMVRGTALRNGARFFRITGQDGMVAVAMGQSLSNLTDIGVFPPSADLTRLFLDFGLSTNGNGASAPIAATVLGVNAESPDGVRCAVSTLADGFDDGKISREWTSFNNSDCNFGTPGQLEITADVTGTVCEVRSAQGLVLDDVGAFVRLEMGTLATTRASLQLSDDFGGEVVLTRTGEVVEGRITPINGTELTGVEMPESDTVWLRIRLGDISQQPQIILEYSEDKNDWVVVLNGRPDLVNVDRMQLELLVFDPAAAPATARFDDLNIE